MRSLQIIPKLWILNIELVSRHSFGAWNLDVAIKFVEYLCVMLLDISTAFLGHTET
jgi:hypothetical protein